MLILCQGKILKRISGEMLRDQVNLEKLDLRGCAISEIGFLQ
jgi:hypothetical protein